MAPDQSWLQIKPFGLLAANIFNLPFHTKPLVICLQSGAEPGFFKILYPIFRYSFRTVLDHFGCPQTDLKQLLWGIISAEAYPYSYP